MTRNLKDLEMTEVDLLGHSVDELKCVQCGGAFCGLRVGRVLEGKPLIMCSRKDATREVLEHLGRR